MAHFLKSLAVEDQLGFGESWIANQFAWLWTLEATHKLCKELGYGWVGWVRLDGFYNPIRQNNFLTYLNIGLNWVRLMGYAYIFIPRKKLNFHKLFKHFFKINYYNLHIMLKINNSQNTKINHIYNKAYKKFTIKIKNWYSNNYMRYQFIIFLL